MVKKAAQKAESREFQVNTQTHMVNMYVATQILHVAVHATPL